MKSESELLRVKDFVDSSYNNFGNKLYSMSGGKYLETTAALGYCYKNESISSTTSVTAIGLFVQKQIIQN